MVNDRDSLEFKDNSSLNLRYVSRIQYIQNGFLKDIPNLEKRRIVIKWKIIVKYYKSTVKESKVVAWDFR